MLHLSDAASQKKPRDRGRIEKFGESMLKSTLIGTCVIIGLVACYYIIYYGSYVWENPSDLRRNEAWMGVGLGVVYGLPFWLTASIYCWVRRAELSTLGKFVTCSPLIIGSLLVFLLLVRKSLV